MNRQETVEQLKRVWAVLASDLDEALAYGRQNSSAFAHRTLVRTHFAMIEGLSYQLRQVTLTSLEGTDLVTPIEIALLREERYFLNGKGHPEPKEDFQTFLPSLLFSIRSYLKNHGATYEPDTSHHGWEALRKAVDIRNRLMHPKSEACLHLSETDLKIFTEAAAWWKKTILGMFSACDEADDYWRSQLMARGQ
ncbi:MULTISPECIES: hypothetical protein [unclassified Uliginosibacterium]|uniref:hypothetical protein n=1 Tax=unclassified Uliginosibacterium TaxID=2621521 RepID=UPI000C7D68D5|nr:MULTISPECIES: hypothetical protein [unclassified Uliginosibacterium]MDO6387499.1 hypothetical protein [Uliginosibacterium sp. 31-12]PLK47121.1 hypothetical protein C0V76_18885 [Uliginosibacterium sp. TH139]